MKKKKQKSEKQGAPEFELKEFSPEEGRIYEEAVNHYREAIAAGKKLKDAYAAYTVNNEELRAIIHADFLKILIAERHFGGRVSMEALAGELDVPLDLLKQTLSRMLQEVGITAQDQFIKETGGIASATND